MKNVDGFIPTEPTELNFQLPEDVEQELKRRETEDLTILLEELSTI